MLNHGWSTQADRFRREDFSANFSFPENRTQPDKLEAPRCMSRNGADLCYHRHRTNSFGLNFVLGKIRTHFGAGIFRKSVVLLQ